uniref:Uncharacterized protein n=1 Tax=Glossina pallidipes TaxID=7398 RepID=A0A1A9ZSB7_GLOPL
MRFSEIIINVIMVAVNIAVSFAIELWFYFWCCSFCFCRRRYYYCCCAAMMTDKDNASMTTVQMKADYAASEVYSTASEPPPVSACYVYFLAYLSLIFLRKSIFQGP